ncbi:Protein of unknown function [Gryllus bimaculatus]|nr:Protein of unknown function [Gryllus bimaculatus]
MHVDISSNIRLVLKNPRCLQLARFPLWAGWRAAGGRPVDGRWTASAGVWRRRWRATRGRHPLCNLAEPRGSPAAAAASQRPGARPRGQQRAQAVSGARLPPAARPPPSACSHSGRCDGARPAPKWRRSGGPTQLWRCRDALDRHFASSKKIKKIRSNVKYVSNLFQELHIIIKHTLFTVLYALLGDNLETIIQIILKFLEKYVFKLCKVNKNEDTNLSIILKQSMLKLHVHIKSANYNFSLKNHK